MKPGIAVAYVAGMSLLTFLAFGFDKWKAKRAPRNRTPEAVLLGLSFLGGFAGGWLGLEVFRHKTKRTAFKLKLLAVTLVSPLWLVVWFLLDRPA